MDAIAVAMASIQKISLRLRSDSPAGLEESFQGLFVYLFSEKLSFRQGMNKALPGWMWRVSRAISTAKPREP